MSKEENKITVITNESNESLIEIKYNLTKQEDLKNEIALSSSVTNKINSALQTTEFIAQNIKNKNQYVVHFPNGIGKLQESKKHPGCFYGDIIDKKNKYIDKALLEKVPKSNKVVSNIANVASIATQQYYLENIDKKLEIISNGIEDIKDFLEIDKISKLEGIIQYLKGIYRIIDIIGDDEEIKTSKLAENERIQRDLLSEINFYKSQIEIISKKINQKTKKEEIEKRIKKLTFYIRLYKSAIRLYIYCRIVELMLRKKEKEEYINSIIDELAELIQTQNNDVEKWKKIYNDYINNANVYQDNYLLKALQESGENLHYRVTLDKKMVALQALIKLAGKTAGKVNDKMQQKKDMQKEEIQNRLNESLELDSDFLNNVVEEIEIYVKMQNIPFKIIYDNGKTYLTFDE